MASDSQHLPLGLLGEASAQGTEDLTNDVADAEGERGGGSEDGAKEELGGSAEGLEVCGDEIASTSDASWRGEHH